jgi:corrinoid protein of di/trimethylamine methyltransferase
MANMDNKEEVLQSAIDSILKGDQELAEAAAKKAIDLGLDPVEMINKGYSEGMRIAGDLFDRGEVFLPELIIASEAMVSAVKILETAMPQAQDKKMGTVVIGTIEGDVHDIGKGIVATMLRVYGFEVHDLGRDVPIKKFVEKAKETNANIVGSSALMTTTMVGQKTLEKELEKAGLRAQVKTMLGGAVATQRWADKIGADAYGESAMEAIAKARELVTE